MIVERLVTKELRSGITNRERHWTQGKWDKETMQRGREDRRTCALKRGEKKHYKNRRETLDNNKRHCKKNYLTTRRKNGKILCEITKDNRKEKRIKFSLKKVVVLGRREETRQRSDKNGGQE